ncbi:hypothetical protein TWF173_004156 [Orbilia oligospora]|uniref:Uncharacterized protein n=2 Tax=Orbilia oligospora TaxID=2813651 RepID=G1XD02_ARTOA|nr:hypothetical protein AOL_s00079g105 [Orbilia oligospora ATCC 24927]KAF3162138.1 hypothetical protein TWF751_011073 [Orbilia oligospora]EGX48884.1 hypothetical protein AOL_s00079g105 [Orbilia oligospora ATCC 24927]KAF3183110.1 hypothetical protein TWF225_006268 [Orbilia oligospora]KAF3188669.1 hypothetical protein TWF788_000412 [Orbilia oligospora]KAF3202517.1 hypothetical protein TWF679_010763 [Orbilia oligospora]
MASRWFESIIGGIIGSIVGSSAVAYYIFHIQKQNDITMDRVNYNIKRLDNALTKFNSSAGDLMGAMDGLAFTPEAEDREERFY